LAKSASGALDLIPVVSVVNISSTLDDLAKRGFWRVALAGDGETPLNEVATEGDIALVLGSEGSGIRRLVRDAHPRGPGLILPGLVDAHIHIESSLLPPAEFAQFAEINAAHYN